MIDIICQQPATARFIARHMYNFFVADEVQVPAWETVAPRDPEAIQTLVNAYFENDYEIRSILRVLFNSDFFKEAAFAKVKSPAELVAGTARMAGTFRRPSVNDLELATATNTMGQGILDPPSVEGWHTGREWITTASLVQRVNFAAKQFSDSNAPGVHTIVEQMRAHGGLPAERAVDICLDLMGPLSFSDSARQELVDFAKAGGEITFGSPEEDKASAERIQEILQLVVSTREYQWA